MTRPDPHSHTDLAQPHQEHLEWKAGWTSLGGHCARRRPSASIAEAQPWISTPAASSTSHDLAR